MPIFYISKDMYMSILYNHIQYTSNLYPVLWEKITKISDCNIKIKSNYMIIFYIIITYTLESTLNEM